MASCLSSSLDAACYYDSTGLDLFTNDLFEALNHDVTTISPESERRSSGSSSSSSSIRIPTFGTTKSLPSPSSNYLENVGLPTTTSYSLPTSLSDECKYHSYELSVYCDDCRTLLCRECVLRNHRGHHFTPYTSQLWNDKSAILHKQLLENNYKKFQAQITSLKSTINNLADQIISAADARRNELLHLVKKIEDVKNTSWTNLNSATKLSRLVEDGQLFDEKPVDFLMPDISLYHGVRSMGTLVTSVSPRSCFIVEERIKKAKLHQINNFTIRSVDLLNQNMTKGGLNFQVDVISGINTNVPVQVCDSNDGTYGVSYRPLIEGLHTINIMVKGVHIKNSPIQVEVTMWRDYRTIREAVSVFGSEGDNDGQFCRPWGVCCDPDDRIIVADRSNNRIQVFNFKGQFLLKFGKEGCGPGEFKRPAGVAANKLGQIIVADKDNHRVQVFSSHGVFIFKFGEEGSLDGQFRYPWDVAVNDLCQIVVSDTKNHRVQLFNHEGVFLRKYGFETCPQMWKQFDSPRGITFTTGGRIIVTDFNNHRLAIIDHDFKKSQFLGAEGSGPQQFFRPQGVAVDNDGRIAVADSRNYRVQILEPNGKFLWQFGTEGTNLSNMNRPQGICFTRNSRIVVVDFGNNRIQIF